MLKRLTKEDAFTSACIHMEGMPHDFLTQFGMRFLEYLHELLISSEHIITIGYFQRKKLIGIILVASNTKKALTDVYKRGFLKLCYFTLKKLITKPRIIYHLIQTFLYGQKYEEEKCAEILVLSVTKNHHRKGIGFQLVTRAKQKLREVSIQKLKVGTLINNTKANNFYKKHGGIFSHVFSIYCRTWNVYYFTLT